MFGLAAPGRRLLQAVSNGTGTCVTSDALLGGAAMDADNQVRGTAPGWRAVRPSASARHTSCCSFAEWEGPGHCPKGSAPVLAASDASCCSVAMCGVWPRQCLEGSAHVCSCRPDPCDLALHMRQAPDCSLRGFEHTLVARHTSCVVTRCVWVKVWAGPGPSCQSTAA